jgi:hypothetical protein
MKCPHCGADNADSSTFCSLCLGKFTGGGPQPGAAQANPASAGSYSGNPQMAAAEPSQYVSPGDFHSLAREMYANPGPTVQGQPPAAYYQATISHPGAIGAARPPRIGEKISPGYAIILVLGRSFLAYLLLFGVNFLIGLFLLGAAFGGSETGLSFGVAMMYAAQALVLVLAGYMVSSTAMEAGRGWLYGLACVAAVIFFWEPLTAMVVALFMTGRMFVPIFNIVGVMIAVFLYLPLGALGGWIADKRNFG